MSDRPSESWDDGSSYEPDLGPQRPDVPPPPDAVRPNPQPAAEPTVPLPQDFGQQPGAQSQGPPPPPPMPAGGYPAAGPGGYPPAQTRDSQSVGALVSGILALLFVLFCALLSVPLGIVAIVLGVQGRKRARLAGMGTGMATAGVVLGVVALVLTVVGTIIAIAISAGS